MSCVFKRDHQNDYEYIKLPGGMVVTRQVYRNWIHWKYIQRHQLKKREKPHLLEKLLMNLPSITRKTIQKATRK